MDNLTIWNDLRQVPKEAKKTIQAGRLKGMTDIKPQWRLKIMTEQFGACGIGWYPEIKRTWTQTDHDETSAYVEIALYVKVDGEWSKPIPGIGGSMLLTLEKGRTSPHHSDECFKMAYTDALSVAMKTIGVAADVYMGLSDSKYDKPSDNSPQAHSVAPKAELATIVQKATLKDYMAKFTAMNDSKAIDFISENLNNNDLTKKDADVIIARAKTKIGETNV